MGWYDMFSKFYDSSVADLYIPFREAATTRLGLEPGMRVLDAGCGTGLSFEWLAKGVGETGQVVGVDLSSGMLKQAAKKIEANEWSHITLEQGSLLTLERAQVEPHLAGAEGFDRGLCFLILSALKDWPDAFERVWSLIRPGGQLVIVDAHTEKLGFQGRMVNLTARADIRRQVWTALEGCSERFVFERLDAPHAVGGDIIIASGFKPVLSP